MKKMIYRVGDHGYSSIPILFETDCELNSNKIEDILEEEQKPRRDMSFYEFETIMRNMGYKIKELEYNTKKINLYTDHQVIYGPTSNY